MENVNPYNPPLPASDASENAVSDVIGAVTTTVVLTPEHYVEALKRCRSQHFGRRIWRWVRYAVALVFLLVALGGLAAPQSHMSASKLGLAGFMLALAFFMFFPHKIDDFFARRSFLKSPHCNIRQTMRFTDHGLYSSSEVQEGTLKWTAFSRAVIFKDGILIFQGPKLAHWIPDSGLEDSADSAKLRSLVKSKLETRIQS